jgi:hypothetical protein
VQLEDKLQMLCNKQTSFIEHVEGQLQQYAAESGQSIENSSRKILAEIRELSCNTDNNFRCGNRKFLSSSFVLISAGALQVLGCVIMAITSGSVPMCSHLRDRVREDLAELSEKCSELNEHVDHSYKAAAAHVNKLDLTLDDLSNSHEQLRNQQQAQNAHLTRMGRIAEQDRVDVNEKLDHLRDQVLAASRASDAAGR